jgi:hypothetical protein
MRTSAIADLTLCAAVTRFAGRSGAYPSHVRCVAADAGVTGASSGRNQCARDGNNPDLAEGASRVRITILQQGQSSNGHL